MEPLASSRWKYKLEQKQRREAALRKEGYEIRKREAKKGPREKKILTVEEFKKQLKAIGGDNLTRSKKKEKMESEKKNKDSADVSHSKAKTTTKSE